MDEPMEGEASVDEIAVDTSKKALVELVLKMQSTLDGTHCLCCRPHSPLLPL